MSEIKKVPILRKAQDLSKTNKIRSASNRIYGSKRLTQEQKLVVNIAKPVANYAVAKLIGFFIKK